MQPQSENVEPIGENMPDNAQNIEHFLSYTKWVCNTTQAEIEELDRYIHDKIKDLIHKFQEIASNTISQEEKAKSADKENEKKIMVSGRKFSYSEAATELNRLTEALLADSVLTYERTLLRKKMEDMTRALLTYAETSEDFTSNTKVSVGAIKKSVLDIIVAFQFQDFVTQRLTHIIKVFESIDSQIDSLNASVGANLDANSIPDEMIDGLLSKFFLSKVKENYIARLDPEKAKNLSVEIESDEDDIELF